MADFLGTLAGRAIGTAPTIRPMPATYRPRSETAAEGPAPSGFAAEPTGEIVSEREVDAPQLAPPPIARSRRRPPAIAFDDAPPDPGPPGESAGAVPQARGVSGVRRHSAEVAVEIPKRADAPTPIVPRAEPPPSGATAPPPARHRGPIEFEARREVDARPTAEPPARVPFDDDRRPRREPLDRAKPLVREEVIERSDLARTKVERGDAEGRSTVSPAAPRDRPGRDRDDRPSAVRPREAAQPPEPPTPDREPAGRPVRPSPGRDESSQPELRGESGDRTREAPATVVTVTIGRIEIKAAPTSPSRGGGGTPAPRTGPSLAEYLSGGRRGGTS